LNAPPPHVGGAPWHTGPEQINTSNNNNNNNNLNKAAAGEGIERSVYESNRYVQEYLGMHYGAVNKDYLPYANAPIDGLNFCKRLADLCGELIAG
jgi:hypothetical protein